MYVCMYVKIESSNKFVTENFKFSFIKNLRSYKGYSSSFLLSALNSNKILSLI